MKVFSIVISLLASLSLVAAQANTPLPIVLWHGMGDNCCSSYSMGRIKSILERDIGSYVVSIKIGQTPNEDANNGFFKDVNEQVAMVCEQLSADVKLANGFNAIGFSQGGQFLRAYVQRCNRPAMRNLISLGGQHQGVSGLPHCTYGTFCTIVKKLLSFGAYTSFVQKHLVQAQYWNDPTKEENYLNYCTFLPDINNALPQKNQTYKENLMGLNKFVMIKFSVDTMVVPRESEWFETFNEDGSEIIPLKQSKLYTEDWLGLQEMDKANKLEFIEVEGDHLQCNNECFSSLYKYLDGSI